MSATVTIARRSRSIVLTITLPLAVVCAAAAGILSILQNTPAPRFVYRPPVIALIQPSAGGSVPQERPVVIFRFAAEQQEDPIDAASFHVALDGDDRTAGFQLSAAEAWGSLADRGTREPLELGSHTIEARICTVRGICATAVSAIVVRPG